MSKKIDVLRAWRDPEYYSSLTSEERAALPANPAAQLELGDDVLDSITGGCNTVTLPTSGICTPCPPVHCY